MDANLGHEVLSVRGCFDRHDEQGRGVLLEFVGPHLYCSGASNPRNDPF